MKKILLMLFILVSAVACFHNDPLDEPNVLGLTSQYKFRDMTSSEKLAIVTQAEKAKGVPYVWGGQTKSDGIDCSGLIVWSSAMLGYPGFRHGEYVVFDVSSSQMYADDVDGAMEITDTKQLKNYEPGDLLFFDANHDGKIEHVAIFMYYDEANDAVWVWDSSTNAGGVSYRQVKDFIKKGPKIGRPMMPVRIR